MRESGQMPVPEQFGLGTMAAGALFAMWGSARPLI